MGGESQNTGQALVLKRTGKAVPKSPRLSDTRTQEHCSKVLFFTITPFSIEVIPWFSWFLI
uniref:Uncharacterized protein n=1 Tax=Amphimedon queenslandica TaxID=400682 RepID=A0A1X7UUS8_AMPQE